MATRLSQYRRVEPALVEQRQAPRHRVLISTATLQKRGKSPAEAELRDMSIYGCRLACAVPFTPGERLWLTVPHADPILASVVWNDGNQIGCRFQNPVDRAVVRRLTLVIC